MTGRRHLGRFALPAVLTALLGAVVALRADAADPPGRIGRLSYASGPVSFRSRTVTDWAAATLNYPVTTGDELWSGAGGRAEVHVGSSAVRLGAQTLADFLDVRDHSTQIRLAQGSLFVRVRRLSPEDSYEIDMPGGAVSLLRPGHYRIDVSPDGRTSTTTVRDGSAEVSTGGAAVTVRPGQAVRITGQGSSPYAVTPAVAVDAWERWCDSRDRRDDDAASLRYVSPELVGFEDLDDYGTWRVDATFGPVWVPAVAAGWAPYRFGYWDWVDPWGWTWIDDAPWGFAPFHYGRWAFLGGAWAWVPGELVDFPVYAPALVAFVGGSGFDLSLSFGLGGGVGWFPLAPGEVFVPAYRVSRTYVREVNVTNVNVRSIDFTKIDVAKVRYANRSVPGAVTAVPREAFLGRQPVARAAVRVPPSALAKAAVVGTTAPITPTRESLAPRTAGHRVAVPPAAAVNRQVVTRRTPLTPSSAERTPAAAPRQVRPAATSRPPTVRPASAPAARRTASAPATWEGPSDESARRQWEAERSDMLARQATERAVLERRQQSELRERRSEEEVEQVRQRQAEEQAALAARHRAESEHLDRRYGRERRG